MSENEKVNEKVKEKPENKAKKINIEKTEYGIEDWIPVALLEKIKRIILIILGSVIMAINLKSFVDAGNLIPGGFTGITLLIQRIIIRFFNVEIPFTLINFLLNLVPAVISFKVIGKRFTIYSCIAIVLTSVLTDLIPSVPITNDILLICVFGGIINGFAISLCLLARATSGGTDFIAVAISEKYNIDAWNYILFGNAVIIVIAGYIFGWDKALYSIIFQFAATQVVKMMDMKYKRNTLLIISDKAEIIYSEVIWPAHHSGTLFQGEGLYNQKNQKMIYTVISANQSKDVIKKIESIDPNAFINVLKTEKVVGKFFQIPND